MRLKIVIPILLLGIAGVLVMIWNHGPPQIPAPPAVVAAAAAPPISHSIAAAPPAPPVEPAASPAAQAVPIRAPETPADYVARRINELMDLAMSDNPASLDTILSELNNPNPDIRAAAVTAAVQFKSPAAIPALQAADSDATDPAEKLRLRDAIAFLSLPSADTNATPKL